MHRSLPRDPSSPREQVERSALARSVSAFDDALDAHVRDTALGRDLSQRSAGSVRFPDRGVTLGRANNIDTKTAQVRLGHADPALTLKVYARRRPSRIVWPLR
jgi:hypothetical protein